MVDLCPFKAPIHKKKGEIKLKHFLRIENILKAQKRQKNFNKIGSKKKGQKRDKKGDIHGARFTRVGKGYKQQGKQD